jgi:hemerythrin-like metal-binding protein
MFAAAQSTFDLHLEDMQVQHRRIDALIDAIETCVTTGRSRRQTMWAVEDLLDYTTVHLADEEQFMAAHSYPGLVDHVALHEELRAKAAELKSRFSDGERGLLVVSQLRQDIADHIQTHDQLYMNFVLGR